MDSIQAAAAHAPMSAAQARRSNTVTTARCRLCECKLGAPGDLPNRRLCAECKHRPEAKSLGQAPTATVHQSASPSDGVGVVRDLRPSAPKAAAYARDFTETDRSLIRSVGALMTPTKLLEVLNERLLADRGPDAVPYTMEQLHGALRELPMRGGAPMAGSDWASLRQVIADARRAGVLDKISARTIDDFAVIFALSPAQVLHLKDVLLSSRRSRNGGAR